LYYQHIRNLECPIEYDQVLRATTLRYRCSSSLERSQILQSNNTTTPPVHTNNDIHDDFFKIRRANSSHSTKEDELELEEEEEYYADSDDDDEDDNYGNMIKQRGKEEQQQQQQQEQVQNEAWSLVEVAPFLGKNGRAAHNGNEGESIFRIGAASIMPGVMNMMESLSGGNQSGGFYHPRGANTAGTNNTAQSPTNNERYWLPRRK
jgi:hypothetical protein